MNLLLQLTVVGKASAHLRLGRVTCLRFHLNVSSSSTGERLLFFHSFSHCLPHLKHKRIVFCSFIQSIENMTSSRKGWGCKTIASDDGDVI